MISKSRFVLVYLLLTVTWSYLHFHADAAVPVGRTLAEFPATCLDWQMISQTRFSEGVLNVLKPTDYLYRHYAQPNKRNISLYIGYHDGGRASGEIHSPKHCLPGSGWQEVSAGHMNLVMPRGKVNLVKAVYQKGEHRELFLYWFQVQGKTLSNEYALKLTEIMNSMIHQRRDAAFIRISIPVEADEKVAVATGVEFIRDIYPLICDFLPS